MATVPLTLGTPTVTTLATTRTRYTTAYSPVDVRIYSPSIALLLELVDAADGSAAGTVGETIPAGAVVIRRISRGEFALSAASGTPSVQVTAEGP
jgi:hypothetical protein